MGREAVVLFGSQTGTAEDVAEGLAGGASERGVKVWCVSMDAYDVRVAPAAVERGRVREGRRRRGWAGKGGREEGEREGKGEREGGKGEEGREGEERGREGRTGRRESRKEEERFGIECCGAGSKMWDHGRGPALCRQLLILLLLAIVMALSCLASTIEKGARYGGHTLERRIGN